MDQLLMRVAGYIHSIVNITQMCRKYMILYEYLTPEEKNNLK